MHILKADIFTLEKPDISNLGLTKNQHVILDYVKLSKGLANQGGAIYNPAQVTGEKIPAGFIEIKNSFA